MSKTATTALLATLLFLAVVAGLAHTLTGTTLPAAPGAALLLEDGPTKTVAPATTTTLPTTTTAAPTTSTAAAPVPQPETAEEFLYRVIDDMGWTLEHKGPNADHTGLAHPFEKRIELFHNDRSTDAFRLRVLAHEVGHLVDVELLTDTERTAWMNSRLINIGWYPTLAGVSDFETGAGDFAEAFAEIVMGDIDNRSEFGDLTEEQLAWVATIVDSL